MNWSNIIHDILFYKPAAPILFNSGTFWLLFILVLSVYAAIYRNNTARTLFLLGFSIFFYYKSSGVYVMLLIGTLVFVYMLTKLMFRQKNPVLKKWMLVVNVVVTLGFLAYYKYTNFFIDNFSLISGQQFEAADIFLPVGISFYTFQILSYVFDVYRGDLEPEKDFFNYAFYITFFPQLVAGPIVRASQFLPQLKGHITIHPDEVQKGFFLIMQGLFKKAVLADYVSQYNDLIFNAPGTYSGFENLMAVYGYTLQIYCDFSGYSDMAIGIGKMMGFDLGINFNKPYQSLSITEFWRRWHISLSSWLRDYLYIPLGGNRKGKLRTYINLFITMLLGGLWHGPSWQFVFWGGMHGVGLAIHKLWKTYVMPGEIDSKWGSRIYTFFAWFITFHFVVFLWIFFRAQSFELAWEMIGQIFGAMDWAYLQPFWSVRHIFVVMLIIGIAIHAVPSRLFPKMENIYVKMPFVVKAIAFVVLIQLVIQFKSESVQPFIYFQF
ncbi:MAG: MBOAT family protein [Bacteroidales bacterium]|jgi:D-alanyl-lipoteichoic acid acyltransferase DltB (MBOAT superfamily)|nr:MBOAT family protein [Bacteroidales bacterium]HPB02007.1 MBOAT family protein [Bacteroidales bacterium]HPE99931.1 MBOAT family protein [Bacteroidales bacterium]